MKTNITAIVAKRGKLIGEATITGITQASCIIAGVVSVKFITSYIGPNEYGSLALVLTILLILNLLFFGAVGNGLGRFYSVAVEEHDVSNFFSAGTYLLRISILCVAALAISSACIMWYLYDYSWGIFISFLAFYCVLSILNSTIAGLLNAARQRTLAGILMSMELWLRIGIVYVMFVWFEVSYRSVIYGYCISSLVVFLFSINAARRVFIVNYNISEESICYWKNKIWNYGRPFILFGALAWIQQQTARWALEFFCSTDQVGYYSVLLQIGSSPIQALSGSMMMFLSPILFSKAGDAKNDDRRKYVISITHKIAAIGFLVALSLSLVAIGFNREIFLIFTSGSYVSVSNLLPVVVFSSGLNSVSTLYHVRFCSLMDIHKLLPITALSAIASGISTVILTQRYAIYGASISLLVYPITYLLLVGFYGTRINKITVIAST